MNNFEKLKFSLKLGSDPVGIKLLFKYEIHEKKYEKFKEVTNLQRYCEYVKRASKGEFLKLKRGSFSCVTGEIMLGLKEPEKIEFDNRLKFKGLENILLFPANKYDDLKVDCVLLIVTPRNCMDITEAYTKLFQKPLLIELGTLSGVCSDVTAFVIKRQQINFSFLCTGSRVYAEYDDNVLLCGIPGEMINELADMIQKITAERELDLKLIRQLRNENNNQ
ncbi:MAG: DUF169 domain-containing protein [Promethearchaeota archaeon]